MQRERSFGLRRWIGPALIVALVAVGCSSSTPSSGGTQSSGGGGGQNTIMQGPGGQFVFSPATISVNKGTTLTVQNVGSTAHTFTITDQGIDITNNPGQSKAVTINLAAGTYTFIC